MSPTGQPKIDLEQKRRRLRPVAVAPREKELPAGDWRTENTRSLLGAALAGLGRRPEAEKLLASSASALVASSEAPAEVKSKAQERASSLLR